MACVTLQRVNDPRLSYASPIHPIVREITFEIDGDTTHVLIPQSAPGRAIAKLGILITIMISLGLGGSFLLAGNIIDVRAALLMCLLLLFCIVGTIDRLWLAAKYGRRPMVLTFAPHALIIDWPREYDETPKHFDRSELTAIEIRTRRTVMLQLLVTLRVTAPSRWRTDVTFSMRNPMAVERLRKLARSFL